MIWHRGTLEWKRCLELCLTQKKRQSWGFWRLTLLPQFLLLHINKKLFNRDYFGFFKFSLILLRKTFLFSIISNQTAKLPPSKVINLISYFPTKNIILLVCIHLPAFSNSFVITLADILVIYLLLPSKCISIHTKP